MPCIVAQLAVKYQREFGSLHYRLHRVGAYSEGMQQIEHSTLRDMPKTRGGRWAFGLSLGAMLSGPLLGVSAAVLVPFVQNAVGDTASTIFGSAVAVVVVGAFIAALVLSLKAFRSGERSWAVWFALFVSCLIACFWAFMLVGELVSPH